MALGCFTFSKTKYFKEFFEHWSEVRGASNHNSFILLISDRLRLSQEGTSVKMYLAVRRESARGKAGIVSFVVRPSWNIWERLLWYLSWLKCVSALKSSSDDGSAETSPVAPVLQNSNLLATWSFSYISLRQNHSEVELKLFNNKDKDDKDEGVAISWDSEYFKVAMCTIYKKS